MKGKRLAVILIGAALAVPLWADDEPGRGVARISVINGDVTVQRGDTGDVVAAAVNAPLVVQDRLATGPASRAEVQFDYANMIRVGASSEIRLSELENQRYQIQVARGTVTFRVLRDSSAEVELSTPNVSVRPAQRGVYRVTLSEDGASEITVRSGEAEVFTPRGSETLRSGHTMMARGSASDPEFQVVAAIPRDDWDNWNERRDHDLEQSRSYAYVSRDVYGADDLDGYGSWVNEDTYGMVWAPRVAPGWAPYRDGRWSWVDWYGWTWVSYDPWGWAPYHYGRWFHGGRHGWCWWPGGIGMRHSWSPALVGWFGWGGGGVGIGFGGLGWVPLAPYEPLHRWWGSGYYRGYRGGPGYVNNTTIVNNVNITNTYRNARVQNGITGVNSQDFQRGAGRYERLDGGRVQSTSLVRGQVPVAPTRDHLRMSDREARAGAFAGTRNENFFSRRAATPVDRVPFEQQRSSIEQHSRGMSTQAGRAAGAGAARVQNVPDAGRAASGRQAAEQPARTESAPRTAGSDRQNGWRTFGAPGGSAANSGQPARSAETARPADTGSRADTGGWRRFGEPQAGRQSQAAGPATRQAAPSGSRGASSDRQGGSGSWQRFNGDQRGSTRQDLSPRSVDRPQGSGRTDAPRTESPRAEPRSAPRSDYSQRFSAPSRNESIRMNPPIVQQRSAPMSAPRMESGGGQVRSGGGGGGQVRSGGGGGGQVRSGGGGGGQARGSGGGSAPARSGGGGGSGSHGGRSR